MTRLPFVLLVVSLQFVCSSSGSCQNPTTPDWLKKQFRLAGNDLEPYFLANAGTNGFLIAGNYMLRAINTAAQKTTCFIRADENGCVLWARSLMTGEAQVVQC